MGLHRVLLRSVSQSCHIRGGVDSVDKARIRQGLWKDDRGEDEAVDTALPTLTGKAADSG